MTGSKHRILKVAFVTFVLAALSIDCFGELNGQQKSLTGVKLITVDVNCSDLAKKAGLDEETIQKNLSKQLEDAGIGVVRNQIWTTLPGRCRLRAMVQVYKPLHLDSLIYNLTLEFIQEVALARLPETKIDATTWQRTWFAHGSGKRLAEVVPHNLKVMVASFIRDHHKTNQKNGEIPGPDEISKEPQASGASEAGFIASKTSDVFHKSDCRWSQGISADNLVSYQSREAAIKAGKRPCKLCNP